MTITTAIEVRPLSGHIGAEVFGIDLRHALDPTVVDTIRQTLLQWKVVFFRDQHLTPEQHIAFGRQFGEVTPAHPTLPAAFPEHPEILLLDNRARSAAEEDGVEPDIEHRWHTDVTFVPNPPMDRSCEGWWCLPTEAIRSGRTWSRPMRHCRLPCNGSVTDSMPCTATSCASLAASSPVR